VSLYRTTCFTVVGGFLTWAALRDPPLRADTNHIPAPAAAPVSPEVALGESGVANGIRYQISASHAVRELGPPEGPERTRTTAALGYTFFVVQLEAHNISGAPAVLLAGAGRLTRAGKHIIASRRADDALTRDGASENVSVLRPGEDTRVTVAYEVPTEWLSTALALEVPQRGVAGFEALRLQVKGRGP
jgi:hypothetical protein